MHQVERESVLSLKSKDMTDSGLCRSKVKYISSETIMDTKAFLEHIRNRVLGHPIKFRRLAANSLLIYVDHEPGDRTGFLFWFEPTWHLVGPERVLAGSRQAQEHPDAEDPESGFRAVASALDIVYGKEIEAIIVEEKTNSLVLRLSGEYLLRSFVSDPTEDEDWYIKENETGRRIAGSAAGLAVFECAA